MLFHKKYEIYVFKDIINLSNVYYKIFREHYAKSFIYLKVLYIYIYIIDDNFLKGSLISFNMYHYFVN